MFVLRALLGLSCAALAGAAAAAAQDDAFRGLSISTSGAATTVLFAPLKSGSIGLTMGRLDGGLGMTRADGFNLSLVGQLPFSNAFALEGRLGASYGRPDTSAMGAAQAFGDGLAYGAGLRWNFSTRASATVGWDSQELGFPGAGRETVRATRLGLQWRY